MPRISRSDSNLFDLPKGATVNSAGRVYINEGNFRVEPIEGKPYTSHEKICIGVIQMDENGQKTNKMYANETYHLKFSGENRPLPPQKSDSLSIGPYALIKNIAEECGLIEILSEVFDEDDVCLILDLSMYMLFSSSAIFQHFPTWARKHVLFSNTIRSDSFISRFLGKKLEYSKIRLFCNKWASKHIGSGLVYFCYDSTNTNSRADGIYIVQKGYAKDDKTLKQVNTDYVVRQSDGLPLTFMEFPGSIVDIAEAKTMIKFIKSIKGDNNFKIVLVCDRGYISEENIRAMKENDIDCLLMLRSNLKIYKEIVSGYKDLIKLNHRYIIDQDAGYYGITIEKDDYIPGIKLFFHLIFNNKLVVDDIASLY